MSLVRKEFKVDSGNISFCWAFVVNNQVYLKLKELAKFLVYNNEKMAYKLIDEDFKITCVVLERKMVFDKNHLQTPSSSSSNWQPQTIFVSEPGVYMLMARSNKPEAKRFLRYVYETVLPTIRQNGYILRLDRCFEAAKFHLRDKTENTGCVYLASNELLSNQGLYKIGSTCDLDRTMYELNTASPYNWVILFAYGTDQRFKLVKDIHSHFQANHVCREFFKFTGGHDEPITKCKEYFNSLEE